MVADENCSSTTPDRGARLIDIAKSFHGLAQTHLSQLTAMDTAGSSSEAAGRIRKRRYSTARIQPTRIKKVMQSDEDIGRMIASVPVAIGSAMEHFAERLLESAANIMHCTVSKTLSPHHVYTAIKNTPYFSFMKHVVKSSANPTPLTIISPNGFTKDYTHSLPGTSTSTPATSVLSTDDEIQVYMRATAESHRTTNRTQATTVQDSNVVSDEPPVKRKRGRPRKDEKDKVKIEITPLPMVKAELLAVPVVSSPTGPPPPPSALPSAALNGNDLDRVLMPPPSLLPNRQFKTISSPVVSSSAESTKADAISA